MVNAEFKQAPEGTAFIFEYRIRKAKTKFIFMTRAKLKADVITDLDETKEAIIAFKEQKKQRLYRHHDVIRSKGNFIDKYSYAHPALQAMHNIEYTVFVETDRALIDENINFIDNESVAFLEKAKAYCHPKWKQ